MFNLFHIYNSFKLNFFIINNDQIKYMKKRDKYIYIYIRKETIMIIFFHVWYERKESEKSLMQVFILFSHIWYKKQL